MKILTVETPSEFIGLREEWNALLRSTTSDGIFMTHEWLSTWWSHLAEGRRLHIVTAREGNKLTGILPLMETAPHLARMMPRVFQFLGSGQIGSDYLDAIVASGHEREVMSAFADHLQERGLMLQLSQLRGGNCAASLLAEHLQQRTWAVSNVRLNVCPYIDLRDQTWDSYLATLGPNVRKNIHRCLRNLPKAFEMRVECVQSPADAERALNTVIDLHHRRWGTKGKSDAFQTPSVIAFHREFVRLAAERGWLRILILWLDDVPAAVLYGLRYGPTFYFYQSGFDPAYSKHSVGAATMGLTIKTAIEEEASEYDFLHGNEEYKFHWAHQVRDLSRLELHPPQASAWIYKHAIGLNRVARQMAKRVLDIAGNNAALNR